MAITLLSLKLANAFNSYLNSIPSLSDNISNNLTAFESYLDDQIPESDNFHQTSIHEITKIITTNFKNSNSVWWDNIPTNVLKTNVMILAPILSNLINKSLTQGLFPQSLKRAKNFPVFKSKDKLNIANYRPISILPVISKVYKKIYSRFYDYFSTNNILSSSQFGFWSGASTEHVLLKFNDDILKCLDENKVGIATFMDLSKAFDCADYKILLTKIKGYAMVSIQHLYDGSVVTFPTENTLYPGIRSIQHH